MVLWMSLNPGVCRVLTNLNSGLGIASIIFSECFFILRTYVLWNKNRILLIAMLSTFFIFLVACFVFAFTSTVPATYTTSAIPGIAGCYQSSTNFRLFIPFLLLTVFELGLMTLTLIRAMQNWRMSSSRLYIVLVKHNIFYYACGLLLSVANMLTSLLLNYSYYNMLYIFEVLILAILATRMHLDLWQTNRRTRSSSVVVDIPMSDVSSVNVTA
ncbi:hypothetical protein BDR04DRAFT_787217 [Suillus decipiens]|nr:hypothetical protein BDR04DRAFT_787217 [Suillus decipiens]